MNPEIIFNYKGWQFKVTDYDYGPGDSGNYYNPPEPPEFIINSLEIEDGNKGWEEITGIVFDFVMENGEIEDAAYNKLMQDIREDLTERELNEQRDRSEMAG
jgi:hypothetical protein